MRFLADEDRDRRIIEGIRRHMPRHDLAPIDERGLKGTPDRGVLELAIAEQRVLLTHDRNTMIHEAKALNREGESHHGVVLISRFDQIGRIVEDIATIAGASHADELRDRVEYLPLQATPHFPKCRENPT